MRATPAADPITRSDPPVPAQYAISCQSCESTGVEAKGYIPIVAATRGTLSMSADAIPMMVASKALLDIVWSRNSASDRSTPAESKAPTDIKILRDMDWRR